MSELISLREFARRVNIGEKTIRDRIANGKITNGVIYESGKPKIDYELALQDINDVGFKVQIKQEPKEKKLTKEQDEKLDALVDLMKNVSDIPASMKDALLKKEHYLGKIKELEFKEKDGTLVKREVVYSQLYGFHRQIRNNLLAIPDRITDELLTLNNRDKMHRLIYDSIADELEKLSSIENLNLKDE